MRERFHSYVDGAFRKPASGVWFPSENPYSGEIWAEIPDCGAADVEAAVGAAQTAFRSPDWGGLHGSARAILLNRLADLVERDADELAAIEVRDNGKLLTEMRGQCSYLPKWYRFFAGLADKIDGRVIEADKPGHFVFTRREPLGVVGAIVPWNSPLLLLTWKLAPALAAGNTVVAKPSEFTSASALAFARLVDEAGFPPGVFNVVTGTGPVTGAALAGDRRVAKIAFTGGPQTGRAVGRSAAENLRPVSLELGGKSPNIVFSDADFENAVKGVISGIFAATGQTCIAGSRLLVQRSIHDRFVAAIVDFASKATLGDPMDPGTQVGPVTTRAQHERILGYIQIARDEGAEVVLGGGPAGGPHCGQGQFVQPTILTGVTNRMRIAREEVFGPVLAVIPFEDREEAIAIANDSDFGLAAGVWTQDMATALEMSRRLEAGTVWVNTYRAVSYLAPFGGYKDSGIGRENGIEALDEYLQTKCVWISTQAEVPNPFVMR